MDRQGLENIYLDCLRRQYPTHELLKEATLKYLSSQEYAATDLFNSLPRDMILYILNYLSLADVSRFTRTCNRYARIVQSSEYNSYWKQRYMRDFIRCPPTAAIPDDISHLNLSKRPPKRKIPVVWFDLYQYVTKAREGKQSRKQMRARTLRAFLERKKRTRIHVRGFPDIRIGTFDDGCRCYIFRKNVDREFLRMLPPVMNNHLVFTLTHIEISLRYNGYDEKYLKKVTELFLPYINEERWKGIDIIPHDIIPQAELNSTLKEKERGCGAN